MLREAFLGEICMVAFHFVPQGWMFCDGRLLNVKEHETLYQLLGNTYGGEKDKTFALPDLRGRMPICAGERLTDKQSFSLAQKGGSASVRLDARNLPTHQHKLTGQKLKANISLTPQASQGAASTSDPSNAVWSNSGDDLLTMSNSFSTVTSGLKNMRPIQASIETELSGMTAMEGSGLAFDVTNPYLSLNFIICVHGTYPPMP